MSESTRTFTDSGFEAEVLNADQPVLVDISAEWCAPCRALGPTIDQIADEFRGRAKIGKMDADRNSAVPTQYGVQAIPTLLIFKGGELVNKLVGLVSKDEIAAALEGAA